MIGDLIDSSAPAESAANPLPDASPIRLTVQQPGLPRYRVPVFRELARRPGIELRVIYGQGSSIPNTDDGPTGFQARMIPRRVWPIGRRELWWSGPQWQLAGGTDPATPQVVIFSWNLHYASLVPALLRARYHGVPTILWGHGYSKRDHPVRRWSREQVGRLANALLFYNHRVARRYIDNGWDPNRIFVALNALDQAPIQAARAAWLARPEKLRAFRESNGLHEAPMTLFVSRLDPDNRLELLLHAAARLRKSHPRHQVVIIGKGPAEQSLRRLATDLRLSEHVRFLGAIYDEMKLAPWFLSASAFCYPTNIGLSILHAFGYGLPVVTGDDLERHNPEIEALEDQVNGLLFRDGDVAALADVLQRLFEDTSLRHSLSLAARQTVLQRFTLQNMVDGMETAVRWCALNGARTRRS
ncbi:glycosyltransferase family 4 protein [Fontivita pretiosa]|uniref:glycosyltransferase family 4 protein n=1 Tax=Fontivita pretiosa TaxID=2989684 RepID=UPI003D17780E